MPRSTIFDIYQDLYHKAASFLAFREFQPVRGAASFVYTSSGSGAIGATAGEFNVSKYSNKELHYQARVMNSGSLAFSIEGRAGFFGTHSQIATIVITAAQSRPSIFVITEKVDFLRVGVRAASPAANDLVTAYFLGK